MSKISDSRVVATSAAVSVLDVTFNITVALITSSTVMLSQALQGLSDLITGGILFLGVKRSRREGDHKFQFGYGRELFFWVLVAGIIMFAGTGSASLWFGYQQVINPTPVEHVWLAFGMLLVGLSMNGYAFSLSIKRLKQQGNDKHWLKHLLNSSIVETKATFVIDCLGSSSAVLGLIALTVFLLTGDARFDGAGSIAIGLTMMFAAFLLIRDVHDLIVGKAVDHQTYQRIKRAAERVPGVHDVLDLRTMYLGSERLLVILEVHVNENLDTDAIELLTDTIKHKVQKLVPIAHHIQVEVETPEEA